MTATYIEGPCVFTHEGRAFTARGAFVAPDVARGYLSFKHGEHVGASGDVTDWHGAKLGAARIVAKWRTPRSYMADHMMQVECIISGVRYTGRSAGDGMCWTGKRCARGQS